MDRSNRNNNQTQTNTTKEEQEQTQQGTKTINNQRVRRPSTEARIPRPRRREETVKEQAVMKELVNT